MKAETTQPRTRQIKVHKTCALDLPQVPERLRKPALRLESLQPPGLWDGQESEVHPAVVVLKVEITQPTPSDETGK
jgi:hypothetical protein